ncbi:MAG: hypothetical protein P4L62_03635 [Candidatus Pacebacteria bacterium]|nr:hypothetical protein [Candidatus Paceibacterota bacterium]
MDKKEMAQKAEEVQKTVETELKKIKKDMEAAAKSAEAYIKKNPGKAAAISAGIGAALGAAAAMLMKGSKGKKK